MTATLEAKNEKRMPQVRWESVSCNLCGGDDTDTIHRERLAYFGKPLDFTIVRCKGCGLVYTNPRLADVNEAYLEDSTASEEQWRRHDQAKSVVFRRALDELTRLSDANGENGSRGQLLDVGCGSGHFLQEAQARGFEVMGIEPARAATQYARSKGLHVEQGDLYAVQMGERKFDVITAWDVIEHVPDPMGMLQRCADWLKQDGIMGLRFPSAIWQHLKALVFHRWLRMDRAAYAPTIHLTFFSPRTFEKMAQQVGLKVEKVRTTAAEANTENVFLDSLKRMSNLVTGTVEKVAGTHLGNLEIYCRKI
ncbi:MAG: class I SAM-dependent methyltransferase [Sedimentisphaerales bacterium]|nr:class I SAM-dependent methyltransferase [Sedimentisphaerales bacterium]